MEATTSACSLTPRYFGAHRFFGNINAGKKPQIENSSTARSRAEGEYLGWVYSNIDAQEIYKVESNWVGWEVKKLDKLRVWALLNNPKFHIDEENC